MWVKLVIQVEFFEGFNWAKFLFRSKYSTIRLESWEGQSFRVDVGLFLYHRSSRCKFMYYLSYYIWIDKNYLLFPLYIWIFLKRYIRKNILKRLYPKGYIENVIFNVISESIFWKGYIRNDIFDITMIFLKRLYP